MRGLSLEVRNGHWVHMREGEDPDDRSPAQQTRDRLLRDLALAIHYDRIMPTQGEHVPARSGDAEPYSSGAQGNGKHTAAALSEARAILGDDAVVELLDAASYLADTKPGQ